MITTESLKKYNLIFLCIPVSYTHLDVYKRQLIHNYSNHPIQHKLAAFRTMIHTLNNIALDEKDNKDELNTIKYLAESNGYDRTIVDKLLHNTQKSSVYLQRN